MASAVVTNNNRNVKNTIYVVIPRVIDENQSLFLILTRFLYVFSKGNGYENNAGAMVTYKISSQKFSFSQREAYPFLLKLG